MRKRPASIISPLAGPKSRSSLEPSAVRSNRRRIHEIRKLRKAFPLLETPAMMARSAESRDPMSNPSEAVSHGEDRPRVRPLIRASCPDFADTPEVGRKIRAKALKSLGWWKENEAWRPSLPRSWQGFSRISRAKDACLRSQTERFRHRPPAAVGTSIRTLGRLGRLWRRTIFKP